MKVSNELIEQVERYRKTRSFGLSAPLKNELGDWYKAAGHGTLNKGCATCVRNAMSKLTQSIDNGEHLKPRIHFIGVKQ